MGFSLAAVLIIYYKQISEGYEDQARFDIMQKVGMTRRDIRSSINSQLLLVFFLPLLLAGLHLAFAFPFVHKLLLLFNLWNTRLLVGTTAASFLAFAVLYTLVYRDYLQRLLPHRQRRRGAVMRRFAYRAVLWCGGAVTVAAGRCGRPDRVPHRPSPAHAGAIKHKQRPYSEEYGLRV